MGSAIAVEYEIETGLECQDTEICSRLQRFDTVQSFTSYCRLVKCSHESAGKLYGYGGQKIGNAHLKWAFSEATALFMRESQQAKDYVENLSVKHGKGKAMSILAHKLGRAIYFVIKRRDTFDVNYFFQNAATNGWTCCLGLWSDRS